MAKGPYITDAVRTLIAQVHRDNPDFVAKQVRGKVSQILRKENPQINPSWPSVSAVQRELTTIYKNERLLPLDPQEKPWSMATLEQHPIPPEALPAVLKAWKVRIKNEDSFTVRDAKWATRLSAVLENPIFLSVYAKNYAGTERLYQVIGHPFDTTQLDGGLIEHMEMMEEIERKKRKGLTELLERMERRVEQKGLTELLERMERKKLLERMEEEELEELMELLKELTREELKEELGEKGQLELLKYLEEAGAPLVPSQEEAHQ